MADHLMEKMKRQSDVRATVEARYS